MNMGKLHVEKSGAKYRMVRKGSVIMKVATTELIEKGGYFGAVEKETKNGWLKIRTFGSLAAERIVLAYLKERTNNRPQTVPKSQKQQKS